MKLNSLLFGAIIGAILPIISLTLFFIFSFRSLAVSDFFMMIQKMDILTQTLTICVMPSFLAFFLFYWRQLNKAAQGVVLSTMILTIILVIINME